MVVALAQHLVDCLECLGASAGHLTHRVELVDDEDGALSCREMGQHECRRARNSE